jgi:hypothetical protein
MKTILAAASLAALAVSMASPASASSSEAPWCAVVNTGTGNAYWDCSYPSVEACQPNVIAGNRGFCNPNPAYHGPVVAPHAARRYIRPY